MDKNKKTLLKFYAVVSTPFILSLVLLAEKIWLVPRLSLWIVFLPVIIPSVAIILFVLVAIILWKRNNRLQRRKCCGNCVHCLDDIYLRGKSQCMRDSHVFTNPRRHSCEHFCGSILKNYIGG